ncbi:MarR family transcriptional regulator [Sinomonas cellulolyticus]|uniref:MarR family transcriptional regulator n=1 Tax=Sinomonas cellulolyticus TaxID=2801916 RepID=A0ABS1K5P0_9MICC|nr:MULTISPECIES: MarR family transcriptional regulator [Sinomonas]MBL0706824.1 MarR family transcriptional regulator [Sinomonas cellulolyticus]GHG52612.1 MarR family transcriptional regulator [Sinomonas sp. KCTC 49339]
MTPAKTIETESAATPDPAGTDGHAPVDVLELAAELRAAIMRTSRLLRTQASGDAVSPSQITVLALLNKRGPLTMRQLADIEHVQAPSMTRTVNHLCDGGYVARAEHPTDGRQVIASLTDAGRQVLEESRRLRAAWLAGRLEGLPAADRDTLHRAAELLLEMSAK